MLAGGTRSGEKWAQQGRGPSVLRGSFVFMAKLKLQEVWGARVGV